MIEKLIIQGKGSNPTFNIFILPIRDYI